MKRKDPVRERESSYGLRVIALAVLCSLLSVPAIAGVIQITSDSYDNRYPSIDGDRIVWIRQINNKGQVMMYDLTSKSETQITTNPAADHERAWISGNTIVYNDDGGKQFYYDLYLYDIPTKTVTAITDTHDVDTMALLYFRISGQDMYWSNFMYDIATKTKTTIFVPPHSSCTAMEKSGYYGVYGCLLDQTTGKAEFSLVNLKTNAKVPLNIDKNALRGMALSSFAFSGHRIAWTDLRNGNMTTDPSVPFGIRVTNSDIYMYDIDTKKETQVTSDPGNQYVLGISGDKLWYTDDRSGKPELVLRDIPTNQETRVSIMDELDAYAIMPDPNAISGDRLVYFRTDTSAKGKICVYSPSISGTISKPGSSSQAGSGQPSGGTGVSKTPVSVHIAVLALVLSGLFFTKNRMRTF
jgi:beta propeller repeat protein